MSMSVKSKLHNLIHNPITGGAVLFISAIIAFVWANVSPDSYHHFWHDTVINLGDIGGDFAIKIRSWHHLVNEFLMAIFFFYVGLEIKIEIKGGLLSDPRKAALPIFAALGGMIVPALIYAFFNSGTDSAHGWGIPMATDIAFSLGVLALLGSRVPLGLKIFLTALAIADDLGAVLVIAIFYTNKIAFGSLALGIGTLVFLFILNKVFKVRNLAIYYVFGIFLVWIPFLDSGVHSTIAGVLLTIVVPSTNRLSYEEFNTRLKKILDRLKGTNTQDVKGVLTPEVVNSYNEIIEVTKLANNPSQRIEMSIHPIITFFIMPIFALANAGVYIEGDILSLLTNKIALGVGFGLLLGKFLGVYGFTAIAYKLGIGKLPDGIKFKKIIGIGLLAGMGFTMSLFVAELAFIDPLMKDIAKVAVLISSLLAGIIGYTQLHIVFNSKK